MLHTVSVRHNFETAHRIPHLAGKCINLHGHSWWATFTIAAPDLHRGAVAEFGSLKRGLRDWIDTNLDHGAMLGPEDPLLPILLDHGCKVFPVPGWPTVENVAALLARVAGDVLADLDRAPGAYVASVQVTETHVNEATWEA